MPEEILTDHPACYRALIVESATLPTRGRQRPDASGARCARLRRGDRRVHDRDGAPRRLRPAGDDTVREVRVDVLQLRVPEERVPPPPSRRRATRTARSTNPRSTPASSRRPDSSPTPTSNRCAAAEQGRAVFADAFAAAVAAKPALVRSRPCRSTAHSDRPCPMGDVGRSLVGDRPSLRPAEPERCRRGRLRHRPGCR